MRPVAIDPAGVDGPTRGQALGPRYRQTSAGLYVPAAVDAHVVEQRILEQAARIRTYGAITGWASLRWQGANFFDGTTSGGARELPVPLVVGRYRLRPDPRCTVSEEQLAPTERVQIGGIWCTTVERAVFDEMRRIRDIPTAVVVIEMAVAAGLTNVASYARYVVPGRNAWTGVPFVRKALLLAIDDSRSPQETRMRLRWVLDAGLPPPLCNRTLFDLDGNLIGIPDLFDPVAGVVGEYDGADHKDGEQHRRDVAREQRFRDHGLEYFAIVRGDLRDCRLVVTRMLNARSRARFLPPESCSWTLTPPPWWHGRG